MSSTAETLEALEVAQRSATLVPLDQMYPAPWNPRTITEERLADLRKSMDADPAHLWARPQMLREDGMMIAGNHRWQAAQLDPPYPGLPATRMPGLTEDEAKVISLRDNENYAVWDDKEVAAMLAGLLERGVDSVLTGFSSTNITALLDGFNPLPEGAPDPDDPPPLPKRPTSKVGQVYELGPHRLICGDCRDPKIIEKLLGDERIDLLWTDPPYGVAYVGKTADALTIQNDGEDEAGPVLEGAIDAIDPFMKEGSRYYIACPAGMVQAQWLMMLIAKGWKFHQELVWVKNTMVLGHSDHHFRHEDILYGWKPGTGRTGRGKHAGSKWYGDNSQTTVFEVDRPSRSADHPTQKPIDLILPMLQNSSRRGENVLDVFAGSGSTLIACEMAGRRCFASELSPAYCDVVRSRYEKFVAPATA